MMCWVARGLHVSFGIGQGRVWLKLAVRPRSLQNIPSILEDLEELRILIDDCSHRRQLLRVVSRASVELAFEHLTPRQRHFGWRECGIW